MSQLFSFCYRRRGRVIAVFVAVTLWLLPAAFRVEIDVSSEALTPANSPARLVYERVRGQFGSDELVAIYVSHPRLFEPARLVRLRELNDALSALPFVQSVGGLLTYPDIRLVDGTLETSPLLQTIPADPNALEARRRQAIENPMLLRNAISAAGTATLLTLRLDPVETARPPARELHDQIERILEPYRGDFGQLFQTGAPATQTWMLDRLARDQRLILPLAALVLLVLLSGTLRRFSAGVLPLLNAALAITWTLGLMSWFGIPLNLLNYILPALILVVGATEDIHILHEFRERLAATNDGLRAIDETGRRIGISLLLTGGTTILGFAATAISPLPIMHSFGYAALIGMTVRLLVSIAFLPACVRWTVRREPVPAAFPEARTHGPWGRWLIAFIMNRVLPHPWRLVGVLVLILIPCGLLASRIRLSNDLMSFLDPASPLVTATRNVSAELAGTETIYVTLNGSTGEFRGPGKLRNIASLTAYLRNQPECDAVSSIADIVARLHGQLRGGDPTLHVIPDKESTIEQLLLFLHPADVAGYVTPDFGNANIVIRTGVQDSTRLNGLVARIRAELESRRHGVHVYSVTGGAVLSAAAIDAITATQLYSLGTIAGLLFIIITALFLSVRCGLLTVICNLVPVAVVFGAMGALDIPLNVGTCMVAAITLGLAVDDTIHLLVAYSRDLRRFVDERKGIEASLRAELTPMTATSLALAGGFAVLACSSFEPVRQFGLLSAGVMLVALVSDLMVTPVLIGSVRLVTLWEVLGVNLRKALLAQSPAFRDLSAWQARRLIVACGLEEHSQASVIIRRGDAGDKMYVIVAGEVAVALPGGGTVRLHQGDVFGEVGLVSKAPRTADLVAATDVRLLALDWPTLDRLRRFSPVLAASLLLNISQILGLRLAELLDHQAGKKPF